LFEDVDPHDPLFYADTSEPQSLNKYHYALGNPLRYVDPEPLDTSKIRVVVNATVDSWTRVVKVEAWTRNINWLVTDHLGTPRMIIDLTGTLAAVKRHDYLPSAKNSWQTWAAVVRRLVTPVVMELGSSSRQRNGMLKPLLITLGQVLPQHTGPLHRSRPLRH